MRVRQGRRPPVRLAVAAAFLLLLGLALGAGAATEPAATIDGSELRAVDKPIPGRVPDGCGDAATTDGTANPLKEILCGTAGADTIRAGKFDLVKASGGRDTIYARNGAPNEISGGAGYDTAHVDPKRGLDRVKVEKRYTSMRRPNTPAIRALVTPEGFPYELPTVECDDNDPGEPPGRHILLLDPPGRKAQMAAYNANPGVVDWQTVAWATKIFKLDPQTRKYVLVFHSDWLWDRTYDLPDYTRPKHPPNIWRSFVEGEDDEEATQEPFNVVEPGRYTVRFRYYWYRETVPDLPDTNLADMPKQYLFTPARKLNGKYAKGSGTVDQRYCNFP